MVHTPEPWAWRKFGGEWFLVADCGRRPVVLSSSGGHFMVRTEDGLLVPFSPDHPDMRRLVSCVNFCKGVANEELKAGAVMLPAEMAEATARAVRIALFSIEHLKPRREPGSVDRLNRALSILSRTEHGGDANGNG